MKLLRTISVRRSTHWLLPLAQCEGGLGKNYQYFIGVWAEQSRPMNQLIPRQNKGLLG